MAVFMRPTPRPLLSALRVFITVLLATHVFISAWLVATVDAAYTEGRPSPTHIHSLVAIDKDRTLIDVDIQQATSLFLYSLSRDDNAQAPNGTASQPQEERDTDPSTVDWLALGRGLVVASLLLWVLSELMVASRLNHASWFRFGSFMLVLLMFFIVFPMSYVLDLNAMASSAENSPGFQLEQTSFVHATTTSEARLVWLGIELDSSFSGYDLGLVPEENRTNVSASPPEPSSPDAGAFIAFESTFSISYGKNLDVLLFAPFLWLVFPAMKQNQPFKAEEE